MCDYSLHGIKNRQAQLGEILVLTRFHTNTKGLSSPNFLTKTWKEAFKAIFKQPEECAVCIPDGARLEVQDVPYYDVHRLPKGISVKFRQLSEEANNHRDAIEFTDPETGRLEKRSLQKLEIGTTFRVVALRSDQEIEEERQILVVSRA